MAVLAVCLLASAPALHATLPQMYPTFSTPSTITYVQLYGTIASPDDQLAEVTLQGAYNQLQGTNRVYLIDYTNDTWWLTQSIPSSITVSALSWNQSDPDGALKAMLTAYGSSIKGYIICDPVNNPESCNMATTMAGINDAMVVNPDNLSVMSGFPNIPLITGGDLRTYFWIGSNQSLVGNTTINQVSNPSGGSGTTGWTTNCANGQTLGTATYLGVTALEWTSTANQGTCWVLYYPAAKALPMGRAYVFSVQVAGSGNVYLDAWDGHWDTKSSTVMLNSSAYQTIQITIPVPATDNSNPVQIQVRADTSSNAVTAYLINAAVISGWVAVDTYQYNNLIGSTSTLVTMDQSPSSLDNRDYAVAAKLFTYYLGQDSADEKTLFGNVLNHAAANTPVIGWVKDERPDVSFLSGPGYSHFLNTTNNFKNGSVWASFAAPSSLSQPAPAGIKAQNGYIYVSFGMSDGDNTSFMQGNDQAKFTLDQFLGAVPVGWTSSPATLNFSPNMYSYFYKFLPQSNEMFAGPSGVGYELSETGTDMTTFATISNEFMTALGMSSVNNWQKQLADLTSFATTLNLPFVVSTVVSPLPTYTQLSNSAGTVIDGQELFYNASPADNISAVTAYAKAHWVQSAPLFINALADNATLTPSDMLYIAEQLELDPGKKGEYVFLTPAEMALTEANYHNSGSLTATRNVQALPGTYLLAQYPNNYIQNGSGLERERMTGGGWSLHTTGNHEGLLGTSYLGYGVDKLSTIGTTTNNVIAQSAITTVPIAGGTYDFQIQVAGTGTAEIGVYNGSAWKYSSTVTLSSTAFQTLDVYTTAPASGGLVHVILPAQTGAATVYFMDDVITPQSWDMDSVVSGSTEHLDSTTYDYGQALIFTMSGSQGHTQEMNQNPLLKASTSYVWSADVAGSGAADLLAYEGSTLCVTSSVTLTSQYQRLTCTGSTLSSGTPGFFIQAAVSSNPQTIYVRNASVTPVVPTNFTTSLETGDTALTWTNTVDTTSPGGGSSNVTGAVLQLTTSEMSHTGGNAIQYGGTAGGGATNYAYMKAFSNSTVLTSTSRLNYWIYPQSPLGAEPNAGSTTGLNSTCVAIDIIFTDGTTLRGSTRTDQYWNPANPQGMCNHLHPDQWNYETVDLSPLSGKTVSRIDIGYDQPNAPAGNFRGYVDDISLTH